MTWLRRERSNPDFLKFWVGETISFFGSEITSLALPLTAVLLLQASPAQMGVLSASRNLPFLAFGLLAGVWVDRMRRRSLLIASDLGRAFLLGSIPAAALIGALRIEHLYVVSFLVGAITVVATVAYQSYIPTLVGRERLVQSNSRLEVSSSIAGIAGPGLAGILVQAFTAPIAIFADGLSFVASALVLSGIRARETGAADMTAGHSARRLIGEGLRLVLGHPILRAIAGCGTIHNFFSRMMDALYVLYLVRTLHLEPGAIGAIMGVGGIGALGGALLAGPAARRFGIGRAVIWAQVLTGISRLCIPLAAGPRPVVIAVLMIGELLLGVARPIFNINQVSLRLRITPDHLHGRVNATMRFLMWSVTPVGALLGGALASVIGIRETLFIAALGVLVAYTAAAYSPLRAIHAPPTEMAV